MPEIEQGHTCEDRADFIELLRWWLETTGEQTVGDVGTFGGKPWVHVPAGTVSCHLNADTRRAGVRRFLELVAAHGADLEWHAIANSRGKVNRVALGPDKEKVQYFYLYTDEDLTAPTSL